MKEEAAKASLPTLEKLQTLRGQFNRALQQRAPIFTTYYALNLLSTEEVSLINDACSQLAHGLKAGTPCIITLIDIRNCCSGILKKRSNKD